MKCRIVDTTLRDGEQMPGIAFNQEEKIRIARYLDSLDIYQIEAGTPAMGGEEKESIRSIAKLGLKSKIAAWNRVNIEDIKHSMDCYVDIIHVSVPTSEIQINRKISKDRRWVLHNIEKCIDYVLNQKFDISVGFEDASRADQTFIGELTKLCRAMGVSQIRYADTLGIMTPAKTYETIKRILDENDIDLEFHGHNDFGMAQANTLAAISAGAKYVDCTLGGIGERTGNCDYDKLIINMDLL
ncbi:homocitrate synthase [Clostridium oryzae]|uniref:2-isopropylmalate synthase n=1 Tax=Clostridium oryzae TaxID=1450648 RepID=A0A1V4IPH0_9CLOT|nr:homocitrate synthase [Clostridium oryzae]OPJ61908.1 2-isopropylmalate synthase [Clostridium oryzae]